MEKKVNQTFLFHANEIKQLVFCPCLTMKSPWRLPSGQSPSFSFPPFSSVANSHGGHQGARQMATKPNNRQNSWGQARLHTPTPTHIAICLENTNVFQIRFQTTLTR